MARICIDGNIGCGKTTVLEYINKHYCVEVDLEPVEQWQPYLDRMYATGSGVFEFQVKVWLDRCLSSGRPRTVIERSPMFQAGVFVPANAKSGKLTPMQCGILREMYASPAVWEPDLYIYLQSDPEKCLERIKTRDRQSENYIPMYYIADLHDLHEATCASLRDTKNVIIINVEGKTVEQVALDVMNTILTVK